MSEIIYKEEFIKFLKTLYEDGFSERNATIDEIIEKINGSC